MAIKSAAGQADSALPPALQATVEPAEALEMRANLEKFIGMQLGRFLRLTPAEKAFYSPTTTVQ